MRFPDIFLNACIKTDSTNILNYKQTKKKLLDFDIKVFKCIIKSDKLKLEDSLLTMINKIYSKNHICIHMSIFYLFEMNFNAFIQYFTLKTSTKIFGSYFQNEH